MDLKHKFTLENSIKGLIPQVIVKTGEITFKYSYYDPNRKVHKESYIEDSKDSIYLFNTKEAENSIKKDFLDQNAYHKINFTESKFTTKLITGLNGECYLGIKSPDLPNPDSFYRVKNLIPSAINDLLKTEELEVGGVFKNKLEVAFSKDATCMLLSTAHPNYKDLFNNLNISLLAAFNKETKSLVPGTSYLTSSVDPLVYLGTIQFYRPTVSSNKTFINTAGTQGDLFVYESSIDPNKEKTVTDILKNRNLCLYNTMCIDNVSEYYTDDKDILIIPTSKRTKMSTVHEVVTNDLNDSSIFDTLKEIINNCISSLSSTTIKENVCDPNTKSFKIIERLINSAILFNFDGFADPYCNIDKSIKEKIKDILTQAFIFSTINYAASRISRNSHATSKITAETIYFDNCMGATCTNIDSFTRDFITFRKHLLKPYQNVNNSYSLNSYNLACWGNIEDLFKEILSDQSIQPMNIKDFYIENIKNNYWFTNLSKYLDTDKNTNIFKNCSEFFKEIVTVDSYINDDFNCRRWTDRYFTDFGKKSYQFRSLDNYYYSTSKSLCDSLKYEMSEGDDDCDKYEAYAKELSNCLKGMCTNIVSNKFVDIVLSTTKAYCEGKKSKADDIVIYNITLQQIIDYAKETNSLTDNLKMALFTLGYSKFEIILSYRKKLS